MKVVKNNATGGVAVFVEGAVILICEKSISVNTEAENPKWYNFLVTTYGKGAPEPESRIYELIQTHKERLAEALNGIRKSINTNEDSDLI